MWNPFRGKIQKEEIVPDSGTISSFSATTIGASHIAVEKQCEDYSVNEDSDGYSIIVVCDGHGGEKYFRSDVGSKLAAEAAMDMLHKFLKETVCMTKMPSDKNWQKQLAGSIIVSWIDKIASHTTENPFTEEELSVLNDVEKEKVADGNFNFIYGTTLLGVVMTSNAIFGFHIGDGKCVAIDGNDECSEPIPWDDDCFLNKTTSLCDSDAINRFRFYYATDNLPVAVFIGSDGVDDTYPDEYLHQFYKTLYADIKRDREAAIKNLVDYLPDISKKGSKDDISIAGIIRDGAVL